MSNVFKSCLQLTEQAVGAETKQLSTKVDSKTCSTALGCRYRNGQRQSNVVENGTWVAEHVKVLMGAVTIAVGGGVECRGGSDVSVVDRWSSGQDMVIFATLVRSGNDDIHSPSGPARSAADDRSMSSKSASTSLVNPPSDRDEGVGRPVTCRKVSWRRVLHSGRRRTTARSGRRRAAEFFSKTSTVWAAPALAVADVDAGQRPLCRGEGCKYFAGCGPATAYR